MAHFRPTLFASFSLRCAIKQLNSNLLLLLLARNNNNRPLHCWRTKFESNPMIDTRPGVVYERRPFLSLSPPKNGEITCKLRATNNCSENEQATQEGRHYINNWMFMNSQQTACRAFLLFSALVSARIKQPSRSLIHCSRPNMDEERRFIFIPQSFILQRRSLQCKSD